MTVYDSCADDIRPVAARFFRTPFEREDALQEIWLHIHRMSHAYDPARGELLPWLRTLAANRCKEILRGLGRRPNANTALQDDDLVADLTPEDEARTRRLQTALNDFVAGLNVDEAQVFRLSLMEEQTHDEVARVTGLSARRCKYLRMKLLARTLVSPQLRTALTEIVGS